MELAAVRHRKQDGLSRRRVVRLPRYLRVGAVRVQDDDVTRPQRLGAGRSSRGPSAACRDVQTDFAAERFRDIPGVRDEIRFHRRSRCDSTPRRSARARDAGADDHAGRRSPISAQDGPGCPRRRRRQRQAVPTVAVACTREAEAGAGATCPEELRTVLAAYRRLVARGRQDRHRAGRRTPGPGAPPSTPGTPRSG